MKKKILITGTHFTPAQAVIEELIKDPNIEVVYVGRKHTQEGDCSVSPESEVLPKLGVKFISITTGRLQRSLTPYTIPSLLKIPFGLAQSFVIILKEKPDVVLSFGGYSAVPTVISAWLLSIPVMVHEQTLVSGLAGTISSWFADKIAVSFSQRLDNPKAVLTGNPLRREILKSDKILDQDISSIISRSKKEKVPLILVIGGNQGSHVINLTVLDALKELAAIGMVIHQTGENKYQDFERLQTEKNSLPHPDNYLAKKWINPGDLGQVMKNCDLAISRAGINTFLELAYYDVPVLVIPIDYLYKDEQNVNARFFKSLKLAEILPQRGLNAKSMLEMAEKMLKAPRTDTKEASAVIVPDAAKRVALEILLLAQ